MAPLIMPPRTVKELVARFCTLAEVHARDQLDRVPDRLAGCLAGIEECRDIANLRDLRLRIDARRAIEDEMFRATGTDGSNYWFSRYGTIQLERLNTLVALAIGDDVRRSAQDATMAYAVAIGLVGAGERLTPIKVPGRRGPVASLSEPDLEALDPLTTMPNTEVNDGNDARDRGT